MPLSVKDLHPEKIFLYSLVRLYEPETVVEVGVSQGQSSLALAMGLRDNKKGILTAVDNWSRKCGGKAKSEKPAKTLLEENGCGKHVKFIGANSLDFFKSQEDDSVDLIHVDADHSYAGAVLDTIEAIRVARQLVVVHDYSNLKDVKEACHQVDCSGVLDFFVHPMRGYYLVEPPNIDRAAVWIALEEMKREIHATA